MKLAVILFTFIISVYIFPVCYIFYHSNYHMHHSDEHCTTCIEMFSIVKAVTKIAKFSNIYNSVIIYLSISFIFFVRIMKVIFYLNNNPTKLKVKLIN